MSTVDNVAPLLRVVRGRPTAEELAALVTVLAARSVPADPPPAPRSRWVDRAALLGVPPRPGPGAWRAALAGPA